MDLQAVRKKFDSQLTASVTPAQISSLKVNYLGRKGIINSYLKDLPKIPADRRKETGRQINELKRHIAHKLQSEEQLSFDKINSTDFPDPTLPGKKKGKGSLHLITSAIQEIEQIFLRLGFVQMSYPEVEWEYFAFESLNMPAGHPARDDFETFFIDMPTHNTYGRMLLTPHTSSGQYREIKRVGKPPVKMINIAKTYRRNWDASHTPMFHQFEGLCIDKNINITHLKGTIDLFIKNFFDLSRQIRLRPFHFQFTEPSFEVDISCDLCDGQGKIKGEKCKMCKSGWLELGGAGMVHPFVLNNAGVDVKKYSGWAFGFGIERVMLMKKDLKIDNLRTLYGNDIRFLRQY